MNKKILSAIIGTTITLSTLTSVGITASAVDVFGDFNNDGVLNTSDIINWKNKCELMIKEGKEGTIEDWQIDKETFETFDVTSDGKLNLDDVKYVYKKLDIDKDGVISNKEMIKVTKAFMNMLDNLKEEVPAVSVIAGDVNGDKKITSLDAVKVLQYYTAKIKGDKLPSIDTIAADINHDKKIDTRDAVMILQTYAKSIKK